MSVWAPRWVGMAQRGAYQMSMGEALPLWWDLYRDYLKGEAEALSREAGYRVLIDLSCPVLSSSERFPWTEEVIVAWLSQEVDRRIAAADPLNGWRD